MKAPQKGVCIVCRKPYRRGAIVRIQTWGHYNDSPLLRMRHDRCVPSTQRKISNIGRTRTRQ